MPRIARGNLKEGFFHVLNRGNHRQKLFRSSADFALFLELLAESEAKFAVTLWGYCLMSNHWHLVISIKEVAELSRWMHWLSNRHVRLIHQQNKRWGGGHIYQGRYKSFPIQDIPHLHSVLRYVEANPLRAKLVTRSEEWLWSSLTKKGTRSGLLDVSRPRLAEWPRDAAWRAAVNAPQEIAQMDLLRRSVQRGSPFGEAEWVAETTFKYGMESTIRPRGRPRKTLNGE